MRKTDKNSFLDCLDTGFSFHKDAWEDHGEDCYFHSKPGNASVNGRRAIISVFDGCGGLGSMNYGKKTAHTGAYLASRHVSGAVRDWYQDCKRTIWKDSGLLTESLSEYIAKGFEKCRLHDSGSLRISGSMVRPFPTTLAMAYVEYVNHEILAHVLWAGDSRVYLLDQQGLAQLTVDDTDVEDAMENLSSDGVLTNVLSADGNYEIHHRTIPIEGPTLLFAATDGCFGYLSSPMEFEFMILADLMEAANVQDFRNRLYQDFENYASDDFSFGLLSFNFGDFEQTKTILSTRAEEVWKKYMNKLEEDHSDQNLSSLWMQYRGSYERYVR